MKINQSWRRNEPNTVVGYSVTVGLTYSSTDKAEIDEVVKKLLKGTIVIGSDDKGPIENPPLHIEKQYDANGNKYWNCPKCGKYIDRYNSRIPWEEAKYCSYCGQKVIWDG